MGKRELVLIIAFVAVGALVYQLTAPAPKAGERSFSLARIFSNIHREMRSNAASATLTKNGTVALRAGVTELRLTAGRSIPLTVTGERRTDIAYELSVTSSGPDEATAKQYAEKVTIDDNDLGTAQALSLSLPREASQTGKLTLRVPSQLLVRLENSGRVIVSDVHAVDLRNLTGEATLSNIVSTVTGAHRGGDLTITSTGGVNLSLSGSRAKLSDIRGPMTINARAGSCVVSNSHGTLDAIMAQVDLTVTEHDGLLKVTGDNGTLRVARPTSEISIDVRHMPVEVTLGTAVAATIITTDESLRLTLAGSPGLNIDALVSEGGVVRATDLTGDAVKTPEPRLVTAAGGGGPRVVLRNARGDIVIAVRK
jgi:hypothetical protein